MKELLKARRVLCGSYVYGYYLEDNGYNKTIFEYMQVNLIVILHTSDHHHLCYPYIYNLYDHAWVT